MTSIGDKRRHVSFLKYIKLWFKSGWGYTYTECKNEVKEDFAKA